MSFYLLRVEDNRYHASLKMKTVYQGSVLNKRKAQAKMREILAVLETDKTVYIGEINFIDWVKEYMEQKKYSVR